MLNVNLDKIPRQRVAIQLEDGRTIYIYTRTSGQVKLLFQGDRSIKITRQYSDGKKWCHRKPPQDVYDAIDRNARIEDFEDNI